MPGREHAAGICGFGNLGVDQWLSLADLFAQFCEFMYLAELILCNCSHQICHIEGNLRKYPRHVSFIHS